jgi:hypothetical protein
MAAYLIIGCGLFFLTEALIGLFKPGVYKAVEPESRKDRPFILPIMGSILIIWGMACVGLNIPPVYIEDWALVVLGIPFIYKGVLTAFSPDRLQKTLEKIKSQPRLWKSKCVGRIFVSGILFIWGTVWIG